MTLIEPRQGSGQGYRYYDLVMVLFVIVLLVSEGVDTFIFVLVATALGALPWAIALSLIAANYISKVGIEVLIPPVVYQIVGFLKRTKHEGYHDRNTNFNPFRLHI
jgi:hypothetical protein